ncbi:MAG: hypothetical protein ABIK89_21840 [Planctomycetota bacterium]
MKYVRPTLHPIRPGLTALGACANGDAASPAMSCAYGPAATGSGGCQSGAAAESACRSGAAAETHCKMGTGHGGDDGPGEAARAL